MMSLAVLGALLVVAACRSVPSAAPSSSASPTLPAASPTAASPDSPRAASPMTAASAASTPSTVPSTPIPPTTTPANGDRDLAPEATISASANQEQARNVVDGNLDTIWSANGAPPQSLTFTLTQPSLVDSIQLVVAQTPPGQTTHEIWLGDASGQLTLYRKLDNTWTADGQTLTIPITPARVVTRVLIRTDASPSFVAWKEVRVLGKPPAAGIAATTGTSAVAQPVVSWPKVAVVGSFDQPTQITNAGDGSGRVFVLERTGTIRILKDGVSLDKPFLDISDRVKCCDSEQGFFSVAFPPDYLHKQYFYVAYTSKTRGPVGDTVIARYHVTKDPNVADPNSEQVILVIPKENPAHNGGHLAFGPKDGYLYAGIGDGGLQNDPTNEAQNLGSLKGKILRIDTESGVSPYAIPPTNPFVHTAGARPEVWAYGLRNPWQFSFDRQTGDLYIADVGENNYEEVDFQPASSHGGENYGWHVMEGDHCYSAASCDQRGLTFPVAEFTHEEGNCAVIGGSVYRGKAFPGMQGIYFYGDLCSGRIWGLQRAGEQWQSNLLIDEPFQITDIGSDEAGNLYVADFKDGAIFKIVEA